MPFERIAEVHARIDATPRLRGKPSDDDLTEVRCKLGRRAQRRVRQTGLQAKVAVTASAHGSGWPQKEL